MRLPRLGSTVAHTFASLCRAALALAATLCAAEAQQPQPCSIVEAKLKEVLDVRGLASLREIPCVPEGKAQVEQFLRETVKKKLPPQKLEHEEVVYRAVGVVPDDYDYPEGLLALYVSQIGGYYDPEEKRFIMADWMPAFAQGPIARHELTHALQDQHYNLAQFIDPSMENGDELLAHSSLIEGDATAVMLDIERRVKGMRPLASEASVKPYVEEQGQALAGAGQLHDTPPALKALVLFPYSDGLRFVHELLKRGGYAEVDRAFKSPPRSSREILHERDYVDRRFVLAIPAAAELLGAPSGTAPAYTDTLGEVVIRSILEAGGASRSEAAQAAQGWVGDRVGLFPQGNGSWVVSWTTAWESQNDAREFALAYRKLISSRYGASVGAARTQLSPSKAVELRVEGTRVSLVFSIQPAAPR